MAEKKNCFARRNSEKAKKEEVNEVSLSHNDNCGTEKSGNPEKGLVYPVFRYFSLPFGVKWRVYSHEQEPTIR